MNGAHAILYTLRRSFSTSISPSASLIRDLRRQTSAPVYLVKEALLATDNDVSAAISHIRQRAPKSKPDRSISQGLIDVRKHAEQPLAAVAYLGCETDFVAHTPQFADLLRRITTHILDNVTQQQPPVPVTSIKNVEALMKHPDLAPDFAAAMTALGENMRVLKAAVVGVPVGMSGVVAKYVHGQKGGGVGGRIGVAAVMEGEGNRKELTSLGEKVAMHIAAMRPKRVSDEREQKGDDEDQNGESQVLVRQELVGVEGNGLTVGEYLEKWARERGTDVKVASFVRYAIGEE